MSILSLQGISKVYGDHVGLAPLSVNIEPGVTGLIGANGAGKSTLFNLLAQLDSPTHGRIVFDGINTHQNPTYLRKKLGLLPQHFGCYDYLSASQFLRYMAGIKGVNADEADRQIDDLLQQLNLADTGTRLLRDFSGGMRQRVGIAQALLGRPTLLILDEPSVGLDPQERVGLRKILKEVATSSIVLVASHIVSDIESVADNILVLNKGTVTAHMPVEALIANMQGKVWQAVVDSSAIAEYEQRFLISDIVHHHNGASLRIISEQAPLSNAEQVQPDLEDAYLFYTNSALGNQH